MMKKMIALLMCAAILGMGAALCEEDAGIRVAIVCPDDGADGTAAAYWAEARCLELGIDYTLNLTDGSADVQDMLDEIQMFEATSLVIYGGFKGAEELVAEAKELGISAVGIQAAAGCAFVANVDEYDTGVQCAYHLARALEGAGVIAAVLDESAVSARRWEGFCDTIAEIAPDIELLSPVKVALTEEGAEAAMAELLGSYARIDALYASDDTLALGALAAADAAGRKDPMAVMSCGGRQALLGRIGSDGDRMIATVLPMAMAAQTAVDMAAALYNGEAVEAERTNDAEIADSETVEAFLDEYSPY